MATYDFPADLLDAQTKLHQAWADLSHEGAETFHLGGLLFGVAGAVREHLGAVRAGPRARLLGFPRRDR
ncbi:hypothetical protein [Streptomyces candidus]|uniref:Uncharacterized protein n=1 Tax=Streptomyces candidus TaxID=67283 RepID=A0A7X0HL24_9ACTN|nr:hypothetical protein [Streptomyces candidus]MBB6439641.1 hypothetical protein [Streptomyces candidus]GHH56282.1 hypothetical protein GCM10018773_62050 [Streptomyces candidus]